MQLVRIRTVASLARVTVVILESESHALILTNVPLVHITVIQVQHVKTKSVVLFALVTLVFLETESLALTLTSVPLTSTTVIRMQLVKTPRVASLVLATLDSKVTISKGQKIIWGITV